MKQFCISTHTSLKQSLWCLLPAFNTLFLHFFFAVAHIRVPGDDTSGKGTWWRFDDESVSEMKSGPLHSSDHGGAGPGQAASKLKKGEGAGKGKSTNGGGRGGRGKAAKGGRGRGKGRGGGRSKKADAWEGSDGEPEEIEIDLEGSDEDLKAAVKASKADMKGADDVVEEVQGGGSADGRHITSTNAYLLLYRQRGADLGSVELAPEVAQW